MAGKPRHAQRQGPVSIRLVAARAGVSIATVSNVLNGKPSVAQSFIDRVRAAVDELGYAANTHAARLRSGKHSLAAVVVPDLSNPVFGGFVSTLERLAQEDDFELLVASTSNDPLREADRLRAMRSWRPAGFIVIPCDGALADRLPGQGHPPIVVADRIPDDPRFDLVAVDNARAAGAITAHLAAQGYRSCLVAGSMRSISNVAERWAGAAAAAGAMRVEMLECSLDLAVARDRLLTRLAEDPSEALFALDHQTALVAYRALAELGRGVPGAVAFASFDESEWMTLVSPPITAVRQPVGAMARAAWARLLQVIAGEDVAPDLPRLTCAIEIRGSTPRKRGKPKTAAA